MRRRVRCTPGSSAEAKVALFGALFARTDIYAVRRESDRTGQAG